MCDRCKRDEQRAKELIDPEIVGSFAEQSSMVLAILEHILGHALRLTENNYQQVVAAMFEMLKRASGGQIDYGIVDPRASADVGDTFSS